MSRIGFWVSAWRFGWTGIAATLVHTSVFYLLTNLAEWSPPTATVVAFLVAVNVSFFGNHHWTFEHGGGYRDTAPRFVVVALTGSALNFGIMYAVTVWLGGSKHVGLLAVLLIVAPTNFLLNRYWSFR